MSLIHSGRRGNFAKIRDLEVTKNEIDIGMQTNGGAIAELQFTED